LSSEDLMQLRGS